jgi:phage N-6-adenine-methyltransferase
MDHILPCPTCKGRDVYRHGKNKNGIRRYLCRNTQCPQKTFAENYYAPRYATPADCLAAWRARRKTKVYHRSNRDDWGTPAEIFDPLDAEFGFTLDVCATPDNAKCARYYTSNDNGLLQAWTGVCWMNPPYGNRVGEWIKKAYESSLAGTTVVCLVKATPDTRWWHAYTPVAEVRFVKGRITFIGAENHAPFPSVILIFRPPEGCSLSTNLHGRRNGHHEVCWSPSSVSS